MDRIYKYNSDASYKPNEGRYLQIMSAKDLYIQNITVAENDGYSDSFQVKFPNTMCSTVDILKLLNISLPFRSTNDTFNWSIVPITSFLY